MRIVTWNLLASEFTRENAEKRVERLTRIVAHLMSTTTCDLLLLQEVMSDEYNVLCRVLGDSHFASNITKVDWPSTQSERKHNLFCQNTVPSHISRQTISLQSCVLW